MTVTFEAIIENQKSSEHACSMDTNMIRALNIVLKLVERKDAFRNQRYVGSIVGASIGTLQHVRGDVITARINP